MKKLRSSFITLIISSILFTACTSSPEQYFDIAVLNTNMLTGFASTGPARELESATVTPGAPAGTYQTLPANRIMTDRIDYLEKNLVKLKGMKETTDAKDILQTSVQLYEYVLPVYKKEYMQLTKLYDAHAPEKEIMALIQAIHDKYHARFEELYNALIGHGKLYARRHDIKVNWAM